MPHCRECGTRLPAEAKFCPNCGALIQAQLPIAKLGETAQISKAETPRRMRAIIVAIMIGIVVTISGAVLPIDPVEAELIREEFAGLEDVLKGADPLFSIAMIYGNNMMHSMVMFAPFVGPVYGLYVLFSTGRVIAAVTPVQGTSPLTLLVLTFVFPHAWIEYVSYGVALSESFWLALKIMRRRFREELANLFKAISVCALFLLLAAVIEVSLLSLLT